MTFDQHGNAQWGLSNMTPQERKDITPEEWQFIFGGNKDNYADRLRPRSLFHRQPKSHDDRQREIADSIMTRGIGEMVGRAMAGGGR